METELSNIVKISKENYEILLNGGTVGGYTYDENALYLVKDDSASTASIIKITRNELRKLRDNGELIPGQQYRITDYRCTVSSSVNATRAHLHDFDIIVTADNESMLNENARAVMRDGMNDSYGDEDISDYLYVGPTKITYDGSEIDVFQWKQLVNNNIEYYNIYTLTDDLNELTAESVCYYDSFDDLEIGESTLEDKGLWDVENDCLYPSYFQGKKLESWELKYCIDNDTDRFQWADTSYSNLIIPDTREGDANAYRNPSGDGTNDKQAFSAYTEYYYDSLLNCKFFLNPNDRTSGVFDYYDERVITEFETVDNGKGVIYYMKDEFGNEAPYDFKNIQYSKKVKYDEDEGVAIFDENGGTEQWLYTFTAYDIDNSRYIDAYKAIGKGADDASCALYGNTMKPYQFDYNTGSIQPYRLNENIFLNTFSDTDCMYFECYGNVIGFNSYNNTFGNGCWYNTFGNSFNYNTFGNDCYSNTFGNNCNRNTFGNNCNSNTFGNYCYYNTFGNNCVENTFGNGCYRNTFGNNCYGNTFGNFCYGNTFGNNCNYNTFGNNCWYNTFGNYCYYNTFGNNCNYNTFGNGCWYNTFGNYCGSNTFGNNCWYNTFGNNCYGNTFGNYVRYLTVNDGVSYCNFSTNYTTGSTNYLQNIQVFNGMRYNSLTNIPTGLVVGANYTQFVCMGTDGNVVFRTW